MEQQTSKVLEETTVGPYDPAGTVSTIRPSSGRQGADAGTFPEGLGGPEADEPAWAGWNG